MVSYNDNMPQNDYIQQLIDRFFEGTISGEETKKLLQAADKILDDGLLCDNRIILDLRMIKALHSPEVVASAGVVPDNLEEKLDRHISTLYRRRPLHLRRWIAACSAAATIAAVLTIGFLPDRSRSDSKFSEADSSELLPELSLSVPESRQIAQVGTAPDATEKIPETKPSVIPSSPAGKVMTQTSGKASVEKMAKLTEKISEINIDPTIIAAIDDVKPIIASATVNPSVIFAQPMSTVSQTIDNVYTSFEIVAKALSVNNSTLDVAADCLYITPCGPLHDI